MAPTVSVMDSLLSIKGRRKWCDKLRLTGLSSSSRSQMLRSDRFGLRGSGVVSLPRGLANQYSIAADNACHQNPTAWQYFSGLPAQLPYFRVKFIVSYY
jgi:hypothetical protein